MPIISQRMNKNLLFAFVIAGLFSFSFIEKEANIDFLETVHDFGTIQEGDKPSFDFHFVNIGDAPLVIVSVDKSCGCTEPSFPEEAILPGDTASIQVGYNSVGRKGRFDKSITVNSNAKDGAVRLRIVGRVKTD